MLRALPAAAADESYMKSVQRGPRGGGRGEMDEARRECGKAEGACDSTLAKIRRKKSAEARTGQILVQAPLLPLVCASGDDRRVFGRGGPRPWRA
jgi:hypothetical protein